MSALCVNTCRRSSVQYDPSVMSSLNDENTDNNVLENTIRLQLKKPKNWNWELTTSKSSPNIAFPRILLYNSKGKLLANARESDCVFRSNDSLNAEHPRKQYESVRNSYSTENDIDLDVSDSLTSSATTITTTTSTSKSKKKHRVSMETLKQLKNSLSEFIDQLNEHGIECKINRVPSNKSTEYTLSDLNTLDSTTSSLTVAYDNGSIDQSEDTIANLSDISLTNNSVHDEIPIKDFKHLKRSSSGKRKILSTNDISKLSTFEKNSPSTTVKEVRFNLQKSQSASEFPLNLKEREKRKCHRSKSTEPSKFSNSILERIRAFKDRSSSEEQEELKKSSEIIGREYTSHGPRYFLRTCRAGTLVVCEESFRNKRFRRRPLSIPRIPEAEETDVKPEKIIQKIPFDEFVGLKNKNDMNLDEINKATSELSLNNSAKFCSTKSLACNTANLNEVKIQKRKKVRQLRRCVSAGTVFMTSLSSSDDEADLSRASNKSMNSRQKPKKMKMKSKNEKGDLILTLNNNSSNVRATNTKQQNNGPCADIIDEQSGSDEIFVDIVRRLTSLKQEEKEIIEVENDNNIFTSIELNAEQVNICKTNDDENSFCNKKKYENISKLGQCHKYAIDKDYIKDSLNNNNKNNNKSSYEVIALDSILNSYSEESVELCNNNIDYDEQFCDLNSDLGEYVEEFDNNESTYGDYDDVVVNEVDVSKHNFGYFINNKEYDEYFSSNEVSEKLLIENNLCVLSEATTCSESETTTVIDFDQNIFNNNNNCEFLLDKKRTNGDYSLLKYNYNDNMGSNVSRNSDKGLSGRRTQSSGNLYSEKHARDKFNSTLPAHNVAANGKICKHEKNIRTCMSRICHDELITNQLSSNVTRNDRNKFCGSLPNHLDVEDEPIQGNIEITRTETPVIISNEHYQLQQQNAPVAPLRRQYNQNNRKQHQQQQQHQLNQQQQLQLQHHQEVSLSNNTLSSGIESSVTHPDDNDSFKANQVRPDIQLKLPFLGRSNPDPSCDQGYGSERSPEDELPPPMPDLSSAPFQFYQNHNMDWDYRKCNNPYYYSFITKDCSFSLQITKGSRGLGLSISGGVDSNSPFPGLIRIKRLFPNQPAWSTGKLQPGDIILEANEIPLTGLTNYEALEVLRTLPNEIVLLICRPNDEEYKKFSPQIEPPKPPFRTTQQQSTQTLPCEDYPLQPLAPLDESFTGEFEIIMVKQQGSLGFTLRKEDESVLGHYVTALVREPATTDGRIKPGDKIVAVNDVPLTQMTHEQAVIFLRQAADTVKLRLYRDGAQTPVATISPTDENKTFANTISKKTLLRPEAINLLSDLAHKKQTNNVNSGGDSTESSLISNPTSSSSPRRLKRGGNKQNSHNTSQSEHDTTDSKNSSNQTYIASSQSGSLCSDSEQSVTSQCSYRAQTINPIKDESSIQFETTNDYEINKPQTDRPNFLDLSGQSGSTPAVSRKPRFQFTIPVNSHKLNNFENESINLTDDDAELCSENSLDNISKDNPHKQQTNTTTSINTKADGGQNQQNSHGFTSLPCETLLVACKTESDLKDVNFSYKNPIYQSAHEKISLQNDHQIVTVIDTSKTEGNSSLLKWKGVVLSPDSEEESQMPDLETKSKEHGSNDGGGLNSGGGTDTSCSTVTSAGSDSTVIDIQKTLFNSNKTENNILTPSASTSTLSTTEGHEILSVELNRGWNSRLGFSLQPDTKTKKTVISAIYSDSVAAKDGRLRVGDQLLTVNDESVEDMPTSEIIDLLRILRGSIVISVLRKSSS